MSEILKYYIVIPILNQLLKLLFYSIVLCTFKGRYDRVTSRYVYCCVKLFSARITAFQPIKGLQNRYNINSKC